MVHGYPGDYKLIVGTAVEICIQKKKRKKIRVEAASFLDERIVDMSAEILREAEIEI
jgi:hypothetical protein